MNITPNGIELDREWSELDTFAFDFIRVIQQHTIYVIVSGYVSILLGRGRASEDIDMIIPVLKEHAWEKLFTDLEHEGYSCINAHDARDAYHSLQNELAVRFAPEGSVIPNMEILFAIKHVQKLALETRIAVTGRKQTIWISNIELQIAYKEQVLRSPKDLEDARHLRVVAGTSLNSRKLKEYERIVNE